MARRTTRPYVDLLARNADFRRLWSGQLISLGGDWFNVVALTGLLLHLTGSSLYAGAVLAASFIPQFLLAPLTGVVADRFSRRRVMLVANLAGAAIALSMLAVRSPGTAWLGLAAMAGLASTGGFFDPASRAGLPNVVASEHLGPASVLMASTWGIMAAVGAGIGGVVAGLLGREAAFVLNAASFLVSAGLILRVRAPLGPAEPAEAGRRARADVAEAVAYARGEPRVAALLTQKIGFGLGTGMIGLLPVFATRVFRPALGSPETGIGILYAARGLGTLLGPFGARLFIKDDLRRLYLAIALAMALFGAAYLAFPLAPDIWAAAGIVVVAHLGGGTQNTMTSFGLQALVPDRVRGRVLAFELGLVTASMATSLLVAAWAAEAVDPRAVVAVLASFTLAFATFWGIATRRLWLPPTSHSVLNRSPRRVRAAIAPEKSR